MVIDLRYMGNLHGRHFCKTQDDHEEAEEIANDCRMSVIIEVLKTLRMIGILTHDNRPTSSGCCNGIGAVSALASTSTRQQTRF
jgi:hypothetical protein